VVDEGPDGAIRVQKGTAPAEPPPVVH
jgi:hypothetical protein